MKKLAGILVLMVAGSSVAAEQGPASAPDTAASWTVHYAGPDHASLRCAAPDVPEVSQFNLRIRNVARAIATWQDCYRHSLAALDPANAEKHIPAAVLTSMTAAERAAALDHVAAVNARLAESIRREAAPVIARHEAWRDATLRYVAEHNGVGAGDAALRRNYKSAHLSRADELRQLRRKAEGTALR